MTTTEQRQALSGFDIDAEAISVGLDGTVYAKVPAGTLVVRPCGRYSVNLVPDPAMRDA
jgi:hypothetical protein